MANPEWGIKRICQNCGTKFYDLQREPITCPKCQAEFDPEAFLKTRRARPAAADKEQAAIPMAAAAATDVEDLDIEDAEVLEDEDVTGSPDDTDDEEDEDLIEDASELGEDEDDMAEVIENVDEEEER